MKNNGCWTVMGKLLKGFYLCLAVAFGAVAVFGTLAIAAHAAGFWGILVGACILPITALVAPIYEIVKHENWWPVFYIYGGGLLVLIFGGMAAKVDESMRGATPHELQEHLAKFRRRTNEMQNAPSEAEVKDGKEEQ